MRLKIYILLAFCYLMTTLQSCKKDAVFVLQKVESTTLSVDTNSAEDTSIAQIIAPYKERVDKEMDSTLAYAPKSLTKKDSKYNTAIGNMMADAVYEMANPIFKSRTGYPFNAVLLNHGGIRSILPQGAVTTRTAFEIMPFENEVVVVELSGKQMKELFAYLASRGTAHPISGMQLILGVDNQIVDARVQGQQLIDNETYFIATSDYLQKGGDNMTFLGKPVSMLTLDYKVRNVLIDYFKKHDTIALERDQRFIKKPAL